MKNEMKLVVVWLLPWFLLGGFFTIQSVAVGVYYTRLVGWMAAGQLILILGGYVVLFLALSHSRLLRGLFVLVNIGLFAVILTAAIMISLQGYRVLLAAAIWGLVFGEIECKRDLLPLFKNPDVLTINALKTWLRNHYNRHQLNVVLNYCGILMLFAGPGTLFMTMPWWNLQAREYIVTPQQAQSTDLVMYYAGGTNSYSDYHDLLDVAWDYNVTLSLAWHLPYYNDTTPGSLGYEMAEFIRLSNIRGVKIEVFPCFHFNWEYILEGGYFVQINQTLNWYQYWTLFKLWCTRENCTIDYILWDIEGGSSPSDTVGLNPWIPTTQIIGLNQRMRELPRVRAEFSKILGETGEMGAKTRITTWSPTDALDGDHDSQLYGGQIGYVFEDWIADGTIEYISCMAYTNHWGDIHPDQMYGREPVYDTARGERQIHPHQVGLCIGNINGNGQNSIEQVVNEYHLAIAGGVTSVRLFNGASWVNGWNYAVMGPEWGVNGTRDLFAACRQGGIGRFTEYQNWTLMKFADLESDLLLNMQKW